MSINRRQFILLTGLAGLGALGSSRLLWSKPLDSHLMALPPQKPLLRFGVLADTGTGSMKQYAVGRALLKHHEQSPLSLVLLAGDNIYTNGEFSKIKSAFSLPYQDLLQSGVKFHACLGNHDVRSDICGSNFLPLTGDQCVKTAATVAEIRNEQVSHADFNMQGQRYYTFSQGDVQFFATETNALNNPKSPQRAAQLQWLDRQLGQSQAKVKIVFGHHPLYSAGRYGNNQLLIRDVEPLLIKHRVQLWVNGHDHNYQRTQSIKGVTYLVSGGGGAGLYPIVSQPAWLAYGQSIHSCATVDVHPDQLIISGIDSQGQVIDRGAVLL